jgi:hypothetical protein
MNPVMVLSSLEKAALLPVVWLLTPCQGTTYCRRRCLHVRCGLRHGLHQAPRTPPGCPPRHHRACTPMPTTTTVPTLAGFAVLGKWPFLPHLWHWSSAHGPVSPFFFCCLIFPRPSPLPELNAPPNFPLQCTAHSSSMSNSLLLAVTGGGTAAWS